MVRLTRKKLNRNKMDKDLGKMVRDENKVTDSSALRVNKSLFSASCTQAYMKIYNEGSKFFYNTTLPWDDTGWRILAIDLYEDFIKTMKAFTKSYRAAVLDFIEKIEAHIEESRIMLKDAFKIEDYKFLSANGGIDRDYLMEQFALEVEFNTITSGKDLRATLTEDDREVIANQINEQALAKFQKANEHIIQNLHDCVFAIHERLCDDENVFRDTLVTNLEDLVKLIPAMNIANDPIIAQLAVDAAEKLTKWDAGTLRSVPSIREEVADEAGKILDDMKGLI